MQFTTLLTLTLAPLALAADQAAMDGPAIKALISSMQTQIAAVDKIINGMTDANIAAQAPVLITNMGTLSAALTSGSAKIKSSNALGMLELGGLASSAMPLSSSLMGMFNNIIVKRPVMVKGNQVEPLAAELKKIQGGLLGLGDAMSGQIPTAIAEKIPKHEVPAGLANADLKKFVDVMFDVGIAVFKGQDAKVDVTGSTIWPLAADKGGKMVRRGVEFSA